jgi:hypothetical protein
VDGCVSVNNDTPESQLVIVTQAWCWRTHAVDAVCDFSVISMAGQEPTIAASAARYIIICIPSLLSITLAQLINRYLMAQGIVTPQTVRGDRALGLMVACDPPTQSSGASCCIVPTFQQSPVRCLGLCVRCVAVQDSVRMHACRVPPVLVS